MERSGREPPGSASPDASTHVATGIAGAVTASGQFRLSYVIGRLDRAILREISDRVAFHQLGISQYIVMSALRNRPGLSNAQLARRSFVTPQAINEVITRLERAKLVKREVDHSHRRVLRATITPRGLRTLERVDAEMEEFEERMLAAVSEADRARFVAVALQCVYRLGAGLPDA